MSSRKNQPYLPADRQIESMIAPHIGLTLEVLSEEFDFGPARMASLNRRKSLELYTVPLASLLYGTAGSTTPSEVAAATYHGYRAGRTIANTVVAEPHPIELKNRLNLTSNTLSGDIIRQASDEYLDTRSTIRGLLFAIAEHIGTPHMRDTIITSGAVACLEIDFGEERRYLNDDAVFNAIAAELSSKAE